MNLIVYEEDESHLFSYHFGMASSLSMPLRST